MKNLTLLTAFAVFSLVLTTSCKKEDVAPINEAGSTTSVPTQTTVQPSVRLGFTQNFALFANTSVVTAGGSVVNGDLGISTGNIFLGFPKGSVIGTIEINSEITTDAQNDLLKAYNDLASRQTSDMYVLPANAAGLTLTPGLYSATNLDINSGNLIFDANGDETAVFVVKVANSFTTSANSKIILTNNAQASQIFFQVEGNVSLGTASTFKGNLLANQTITLGEGAVVEGRLMSVNAGIEMNSNTITKP